MSDTAAPVAADPVKQFSVFIENRVGRLHDLVALLAKHNVHIMAMTTIDQTDTALDAFVANYFKTGDANDYLYALEASHDYDPNPGLEKITAPLLAINTADDLINPPELGILESAISRVKHGRAIVLPLTPQTRGHGSHTVAALWRNELLKLLAESAK